jgi:NADPH:quinone reductase-like Zn-dependent oxidoreductase
VDFLISTEDLHEVRIADSAPVAPGEGEALLAVDRFGLTANNVTYAKFGDAMSYWKFFPAEDGWGRVPVWGFAEVAESRAEGLPEGARVFGYLPPSSTLHVVPSHVGARGFVDASPHRAGLPAAYNGYTRVEADPLCDPAHEDEQMLLQPLFFTSWLIDDFLAEAEVFGAGTVVLSSASSKTASGLAQLLSVRGGVDVVGLTSARSAQFVGDLCVYDHVVAYDEPEGLPGGPAVYVDMAGDAAVRAAVHAHYGSDLRHSAVVGATHHDRMGEVPAELPGPRPTFFFAPDRVAKRSAEWGREGLERRVAESWRPYVEWTAGWLAVDHEEGLPALRDAYLELLDGRIDPARAHVFSLR